LNQTEDLSAYDLLRRVRPSQFEHRFYSVLRIAPPPLVDALVATVDLPFKVIQDTISNRPFLACEFNRDFDSYRSPHSNKYFPPLADGQKLRTRFRDMEIKSTRVFATYHRHHMDGGLFSVYLWSIDTTTFGFSFITKNEVNRQLPTGHCVRGSLDCADVVEIDESSNDGKYILTSSARLLVFADIGLSQPLSIGGDVEWRVETVKSWKSDDDHIVNIGELIEAREVHFRKEIDELFIGKMRQIAGLLTNRGPRAHERRQPGLVEGRRFQFSRLYEL
jgi:capping protein beta